jgi:glutamyl-tRNA synthetase
MRANCVTGSARRLARASATQIEHWLGSRIERVAETDRAEFVAAVRGNVLFPDDVRPLVEIVTARDIALSDDAHRVIAEAGHAFFAAALQAWKSSGHDFRGWVRAVADATHTKGAALYQPLRAALTGDTHGPELAPLVDLMGADRVVARLRAAGEF